MSSISEDIHWSRVSTLTSSAPILTRSLRRALASLAEERVLRGRCPFALDDDLFLVTGPLRNIDMMHLDDQTSCQVIIKRKRPAIELHALWNITPRDGDRS